MRGLISQHRSFHQLQTQELRALSPTGEETTAPRISSAAITTSDPKWMQRELEASPLSCKNKHSLRRGAESSGWETLEQSSCFWLQVDPMQPRRLRARGRTALRTLRTEAAPPSRAQRSLQGGRGEVLHLISFPSSEASFSVHGLC